MQDKRIPFSYVELHAASAFSFLRGASLPEDLVVAAEEMKLPAMALVDAGGVYGAPRFYKAAKRAGIRPLVGAEIVLAKTATTSGIPPPRLVLLVRSRAGYRNLCRMLTEGALGRPKGEGSVDWKSLEAHAGGLHCLTGGDEGALARALAVDGIDEARGLLERLRVIFPGRLAVELQRHHLRVEEHRNRALLDLAAGLRLPVVATNGVRYAKPRDKELLDVLTCILHHTTLDCAGALLSAERERHVRSGREMAELFRDLPQAIAASSAIAAELDFTLDDLGYEFPRYPLPPGETPDSFLRQITWNGARARFRPLSVRAQSQIAKELGVIEKLGLAGYFLIVWDIIRFCESKGIMVQGRGSAANSAVCYALKITAVDPVRMDLLFERFLSEQRGEWPDIDLDLPSGDQRELVIQHLYRTYGPTAAAMTANVITYRDRSAAREVGKVLGYSTGQVDALSKHLSLGWHSALHDPIHPIAQRIASTGIDPTEPRSRHLLRLWMQIQNLPRHLGQHSGGMVVAAGRLDDVVPLEPASMPGRVVLQWDKEDCADLGIVKVDLLGLGILAALEEALPVIRTHEGVTVDLAHIPENDPKVYAMLGAADTVGVFQLESRAQMASLPRNGPRHFYDLVVQVAIIRPGPIGGGLMKLFFDRRQGKEPVRYLHPSLEPILARTLGVPIFQEQIIRMAMVAAGFSGGEAEELRRAMGFKRSEARMADLEQRLRKGMTERGINDVDQSHIVQWITAFAHYGFPESHAASFALIAYATAYLKAYHPAAFFQSLMNAWPMGFYHPSTLVKDAQRHGVDVRPIDVTRSGWKCRWEEAGVRLGLRFVKGLRRESGERIEREQTRAPFADITDFIARTELRAGEIEKLGELGALASFGKSRRAALWQISKNVRPIGPLFDANGDKEDEVDQSPLREMSPLEETLLDYARTGLTAGPHLLAHMREELAARGVRTTADVAASPDGARVLMGGIVIVRQHPPTANGFLFLALEDEHGIVQAIVPPALVHANRPLLIGSAGLIVEGTVQKAEGTLSIKAERFWPIVDAAVAIPSHDFH